MKLAKVMIGTVAALTLATSGALAAPACSPLDAKSPTASLNALRQAPATAKPATPARSAPSPVSVIARGAVWLPKVRR